MLSLTKSTDAFLWSIYKRSLRPTSASEGEPCPGGHREGNTHELNRVAPFAQQKPASTTTTMALNPSARLDGEQK
jgi:hypothetical protein